MSTVFIPVEVPDDVLHDMLSRLEPDAAVIVEPQQDPWGAPQGAHAPGTGYTPTTQQGAVQQPPTPQGGYVTSTSPGYGNQQPNTAPSGPPNTQPQGPQCQHGAMRYVPAGVSSRTNKPYRAFWGCPANQNDPTKCKSISA